jgi:succinate dehydrogenase / fumarate reductase, cytochrome b subunit
MKWFTIFLTSSIGKKILMAVTGLFLISFLIVHCAINAMIFYNDEGVTFTHWAHFMGTNPIIRTLEIILILGFLVHIINGFILWKQNKNARPVKYHDVKQAENITWYSRSMTLLGTLILLFLVVHTSSFWIPNRTHQFLEGEELPLYAMMITKFQNPVLVIIYLFGCASLFWHLLHGFKSAFQSLGLSHQKYNRAIIVVGFSFSTIISVIFALMPISIYFHLIK